MNKKNLIITGSVVTLLIVVVIVYIMNKEKTSFKSSVASTSEMDAMINNYESIVSYETQVAVWKHVFKTCPYWKAMVTEQFEMHGAGEGGNLESRYVIEADFAIQKGRNPADYMKKCSDKWASKAVSNNPCKKQKKAVSIARWFYGIASGGLSELKPINVTC